MAASWRQLGGSLAASWRQLGGCLEAVCAHTGSCNHARAMGRQGKRAARTSWRTGRIAHKLTPISKDRQFSCIERNVSGFIKWFKFDQNHGLVTTKDYKRNYWVEKWDISPEIPKDCLTDFIIPGQVPDLKVLRLEFVLSSLILLFSNE